MAEKIDSEANAKMLSSEEAEKLIKRWADVMELDTDREFYADLIEELRLPVRKKRLTLDENTEVFRYQLIKPVNGKQIVEITESDLDAKKIIQRYKDHAKIEQTRAMISTFTNISEEEVGQLKQRDQNRVNAVVLGFLVQMAPGA